MDDQQLMVELTNSLKQLFQELGQTPTHTQFQRFHGKQASSFARLFGGWNAFVQAAGLAPVRTSKRIDNSIFNQNIDSHLEQYRPREVVERKPYPTIGVISDIHWPFENKRVVDRFLEFVADTQPEYIFINGDAWDMYSHSKFPRSHNIFTPREEERLSREKNEEFWKAIIYRSPSSIKIQMMGNHDIRPMKRVLEAYPEAEDWIKERMDKIFTFDGVKTIIDPREEFIMGDIALFHGYLSQIGAHRDFTLMNTINGHTHKGGTVFRHIRGQTLWELNSGFAGDPEAKGLTYTTQKINIWTPGFGSVDKIGPRFHAI